ncbi:unnamed protein product [Zymoseptoria tritici ST99CH_1A5]|uniref:Fe2OG dioxygenase domain-containing protein n=3 Tax=Zymoseptoria tritici TaxID=1047171 RepID=A0A1X7RZ58_ZYMT9|nr:unnamed protein product [Zymoseptoria tritici ST99CH_3D7]SMR55532.1 unnamed protein product [Zymoseptoria tritici ST99CH_1E4]SMY26344.1 unnamed protein product [Zymoseptoria tritici ST99CH_1A5]
MGNKRKRNNAVAQLSNAKKSATATTGGIPSPPSDHDPTTAGSVVLPEDIEIAVETLETLAKYPNIIKSKACKDLRTAVYEFRQACTTGLNAAEGNNLTARISAALTDGKHTDALILLAEMRIRKETPSLGALCRWVRCLDVVSGLSTQPEEASNAAQARSAQNQELLCVLDAILRVTGPVDENPIPGERNGPISRQKVWDLRDPNTPQRQTRASVLDKTIFRSSPSTLKDRLHILETISGADRKPPNHHPAVLFTSDNNTIPLEPLPRPPTYHTHPTVPNLHCIKDILTPTECESIIAAGETVEFIPDAPIKAEGEDISVLAHNFYWVVDQAFHDALWERVVPFIPAEISGKRARGLNRRFRVYRYVPGAEYRCHIDGAWPPSAISPPTSTHPRGQYIYDASSSSPSTPTPLIPGGKQSSLFTFLIYLSDDFRGGETTFFLPSQREGVMNAYPVKPLQGSVAVFPHGEAEGALLHEGTGVGEGAKYVIRTDVEFDVEASA